MEDKKVNSFLNKLKQKVENQEYYGGKHVSKEASIDVINCPNCGAGRAKQDGLTHCAYCGFEFMSITLTNGINIKKEQNSKK